MLFIAYRIVFKPPTNYIEQDQPKSWVTGLWGGVNEYHNDQCRQ
jgi:hypothetical protein